MQNTEMTILPNYWQYQRVITLQDRLLRVVFDQLPMQLGVSSVQNVLARLEKILKVDSDPTNVLLVFTYLGYVRLVISSL